jgi:hypothetical protein
MLVWTDYPGTEYAAKELVNDLDLKITAPGGVVHRGNGTTDRKNNVEGITITNPTLGSYTVNVKAYSVAHGPQPYALVVTGAVTTVSPTAVSLISDLKARADGSVVTLTGKTVSAGSDQFKGQFYIEEDDRSSGIQIRYGLGGGPIVSMGQLVNVTGTLSTVEGERVIIDPIVTF